MTLRLYQKVTTEYLDTLFKESVIFIGPTKKKRYYLSRNGDIIKYYDYKGIERDADIDDVWRRKR